MRTCDLLPASTFSARRAPHKSTFVYFDASADAATRTTHESKRGRHSLTLYVALFAPLVFVTTYR